VIVPVPPVKTGNVLEHTSVENGLSGAKVAGDVKTLVQQGVNVHETLERLDFDKV
jgi:hypothetical protein